jgi:hypothetical protein
MNGSKNVGCVPTCAPVACNLNSILNELVEVASTVSNRSEAIAGALFGNGKDDEPKQAEPYTVEQKIMYALNRIGEADRTLQGIQERL